MSRRDFLRRTSAGLAAVLLPDSTFAQTALTGDALRSENPYPLQFNVRQYGAIGNGVTIDSPAINRAIDAAAAAGGGCVVFPAGQYVCYTIRLKSHVSLQLGPGAIIIAADVPKEGTTTGGHDPAGPPQLWEAYQDFGHNHWANSLIYGDGLEDVSICGRGLIWGRGLSRGEPNELVRAECPASGTRRSH